MQKMIKSQNTCNNKSLHSQLKKKKRVKVILNILKYTLIKNVRHWTLFMKFRVILEI